MLGDRKVSQHKTSDDPFSAVSALVATVASGHHGTEAWPSHHMSAELKSPLANGPLIQSTRSSNLQNMVLFFHTFGYFLFSQTFCHKVAQGSFRAKISSYLCSVVPILDISNCKQSLAVS